MIHPPRPTARVGGLLLLLLTAGCGDAEDEGPPAGHAEIAREGDSFVLRRDGVPYYVNGAAGWHRLDLAVEAGANSTRTYASDQAADILAEAHGLGMTVLVGIGLSKDPASYLDEDYKREKRAEVAELVRAQRRHPALLLWAVGNEVNLGADTPEAWQFVNELSRIIHEQDPYHPTLTVTAGVWNGVIENLTEHAPDLDMLGVNAYGNLPEVEGELDRIGWSKPYLVTEWGPNGHWEVAATDWGRPVEQTSAEKAISYAQRYDLIRSNPDRVLGSYVFMWGQKQERTPTWYGMFVEDAPELGLHAEACPTVDVMTHAWSGSWPANRAPEVTGLVLDGLPGTESITLSVGQSVPAAITATDPDANDLSYVWELLEEPTELGVGGSFEPRPPTLAGAITGSSAEVQVTAPGPGEYRLFAYALDGHGSVGTANVPFVVQ